VVRAASPPEALGGSPEGVCGIAKGTNLCA